MRELVEDTELSIKENAFMVLLNQKPPKEWILEHPMTKLPYIPIARLEYLMTRIFTKWWVEIKQVQTIANSVCVTIRVYVINPITGETEWNEGIGACPIQTDKGAGAADWNHVKANGVQIGAPAAETYAFKDAVEKWGCLFGKDLTRKDFINYDPLLKTEPVSEADKTAQRESARVTTLIKECKSLKALEDLRKDIKDEHTEIFAAKFQELSK